MDSVALGPRLEFKQTQQLVMTPQLQQAIKLLQLSNLELADYVEEQLEENPFLERLTDANDPLTDRRNRDGDGEGGPTDRSPEGERADGQSAENPLEMNGSDTLNAHDSIDADYSDIDPESTGSDKAVSDAPAQDYAVNEWSNATNGATAAHGAGGDRQFDATLSREVSLHDHLTEQLQIASRDQLHLMIGAEIIDQIDEAGYFRGSTLELAQRLGAEELLVAQTLEMIQAFEPSGVAARSIKECLSLQLKDKNRFDPAMELFIENIELLAKGDLKGLIKATGESEEDVRDMIAEVRALTPKPGYAFGTETVHAVVPDIFVRQGPDGMWKVELNTDNLPRVLANQVYYNEINTGATREEDKLFLTEQMSNANWLVKSLDQRARTILKVASEIVRQQDAFFAYGIMHLRPLNLKVVADAIEMHESTVSRATANKYMATPRGLFELKYFFTASIASASGGEAHSAEAVRHRIKDLVDAETQGNVLSDDAIVDILKNDGIEIARRTVAKYRETLHIPSSVQRRRNFAKAAI
ncbi:MAG: RNA polymerase factor sigma-54 [Pseudomonadota bacterium]